MTEYFEAVRVSEKVWWVGVIDWNLRNFHGYKTSRGTTYNAFLVLDKKITLIDTVKVTFVEEMYARIRSVIGDERKIDYIVSQHSEPDHSGGLPAVIDHVKPEKVFASVMGEKTLKAYFGSDLPITPLKTGDSVRLGESKLSFVETRMLHWPDSMVTYLDTEKMLFSQDAFGMHLAGARLFADEYPKHLLEHEAKKYFANILLHLSDKVAALLDSLPSLNLDIRMILPDHGPVWRTQADINWILELYRGFAAQKRPKGALVVYATMWKSTEKMANALIDGLRSEGIEVESAFLDLHDRSDLITKLMDCGLLAVGSPTLNNNMFPSVADALTYITGLRPRNRMGYVFGSYGWSGEAVKQIADYMVRIDAEMPLEPVRLKYCPTGEDLKKLFDDGVKLAKKLNENQ